MAEHFAVDHRPGDGGSKDAAPPSPHPPAPSRPLARAVLGLGLILGFGPHLLMLKLLGPRWGLRYAHLTAHVHWLLTFVGAQRKTRRALEKVHAQLGTRQSVRRILLRHLIVKHHSFAEWRFSVTPRGEKYIKQVYESFPQDLEDQLRSLVGENKGVMFVVFHYGMYKVLAGAMAHRYGVDIYKANYISAHYLKSTLGPIARMAFANAIRTDRRSNTKNIYLKPDSSPLTLVKRLRKGRILGLAADGMISASFTEVPFLGGRLRLPSGWAKLAALTRSPVVVMFTTLEKVHTRTIETYPPFVIENNDDSVQEAVERAAGYLESHVRREPGDWHIWHRIVMRPSGDGDLRMMAEPSESQNYYYEPPPKD